LLKLAMLVSRKEPVTPTTIAYVKRFKPTGHRKKE